MTGCRVHLAPPSSMAIRLLQLRSSARKVCLAKVRVRGLFKSIFLKHLGLEALLPGWRPWQFLPGSASPVDIASEAIAIAIATCRTK